VLTPINDAVPQYRYFTCDLLSNQLLAEIPFSGVSYTRSIKEAGPFSGSIPVIESTVGTDFYYRTMPGKTALYVVRDDECVWGGIIWSRTYDIVNRTLQVQASEFTSYLHHRVIWKTWSHDYEAKIACTGTTATVTLTTSTFDFAAGMPVRITFLDENMQYSGYYTVASSPTPTDTVFTIPIVTTTALSDVVTVTVQVDTYQYTRDLLDMINVDFIETSFPNTVIEPYSTYYTDISSVSRSGNVATLELTDQHYMIPGQRLTVSNVLTAGFNTAASVVLDVPTPTSLTYANTGTDVGTTVVSGASRTVTQRAVSDYTVTLTTSATHGFDAGDIVVVSGVNGEMDGTWIIDATPTTTTFTYTSGISKDLVTTAVTNAATAKVSPYVSTKTYGEFPNNADVNVGYSTSAYSGSNVTNETYRGFELRMVGEALDAYSNTIDGFEYRIDCAFDPSTNSFTRTFVLMPIKPAEYVAYLADQPGGVLPYGEAAPISAFGADRLVFEHPGNILNASMEESAEESATRFWVQGDTGESNAEDSQPYAAFSATDLLDAGWPLLEQVEQSKDTLDMDRLVDYAQQYLDEARPPISNISIEVNGSLYPYVGTYKPGDWCSIIIDDEFVRLRLASDLEPRETVLVRKIDAYTVTVPDGTPFPEKVNLQLVTEAQVDKRGTQETA